MRIIAIDTSGPVLGIALFEGGTVVARVEDATGMRHTENLLPRIDGIISEHGWQRTLDAIAVARGPGSFTGLRIGLATAKGLASAWARPLRSVDTLAALAETERWERARAAASLPDAIIPLLDARKSRYYVSVFQLENATLHRRTDNMDIPIEEVAATVQRFRRFCVPGPDAQQMEERFGSEPAFAKGVSGVVGVALLGAAQIDAGERDDRYAGPTYLRESDIGTPKAAPRFNPDLP